MRITLEEAGLLFEYLKELEDVRKAVARLEKWSADFDSAKSGGPLFAPELSLVLPDGDLDVGNILPYDAYEEAFDLHQQLCRETVARYLALLNDARGELINYLEKVWSIEIGGSGSQDVPNTF